MRTIKLSLIAIALLLAIVPASAQDQRGPSTEAERNKAIAAIDDLQKNPFGRNAKEERSWLIIWLTAVPDIHVSVCTLLPDMPKGDKKDSGIIFAQMMFAGAKYAIQHKDDPKNDMAQFKAGVTGAVQLYEILLAQNPNDKQPSMDQLVERLHAGTLNAYVDEKAPKTCTASIKAQ